jgi:DNA repair exonuclease SbcCD ATPase subunit
MDSEKQETINAIRDLLHEMDETKAKVKAGRERAEEIKQLKSAYAEVEALTEKLTDAKESLKMSLLQDGDYNDLMENIANEKLKYDDQKEMMSQHLVLFHDQFKEQQIELGDNGDARDVIIVGKLGREAKYQTSIFSER